MIEEPEHPEAKKILSRAEWRAVALREKRTVEEAEKAKRRPGRPIREARSPEGAIVRAAAERETVGVLAARLGVDPATVRRWIAGGHVPRAVLILLGA